MSRIAIVIGLLLAVVSVVGYMISEKPSPTAFIPAGEGVILIAMGLVALNPKLRMHAMHGAATIGLLGAIMSGVILVRGLASGAEMQASKLVTLGGMVSLSILFVVLCVNSFIAARRARKAGEAAA